MSVSQYCSQVVSMLSIIVSCSCLCFNVHVVISLSTLYWDYNYNYAKLPHLIIIPQHKGHQWHFLCGHYLTSNISSSLPTKYIDPKSLLSPLPSEAKCFEVLSSIDILEEVWDFSCCHKISQVLSLTLYPCYTPTMWCWWVSLIVIQAVRKCENLW